jgi:prepilin-type N-terminal cleavage/methylation domain-containing protein/prepilin-type processing-associated H-X9-DG protein
MSGHCMTRSNATQRGVTLVELLVVLGVIGLLLALLLPAVQQTREAARQVQCKNHLHQIGLGCASFHESHGELPKTTEPILVLLATVESQALYDEMTKTGVRVDTLPTGPAWTVCPSDPLAEARQRRVSYRLNDGSAISPSNGIRVALGRQTTRYRDLSDGLSTTALFAERLVQSHPYPQSEAEGLQQPLRCFWRTPQRYLPGQEWELAQYCLDPASRVNPTFGEVNGSDFLPEGASGAYNHLIPPNNWSFSNGPDSMYAANGAMPPSSQHPGGVHVLMADGSVRFVSSSIDLRPWWAMGSRNGNDTVD